MTILDSDKNPVEITKSPTKITKDPSKITKKPINFKIKPIKVNIKPKTVKVEKNPVITNKTQEIIKNPTENTNKTVEINKNPTENTNKTAEITKNSIENVNKTVEINKNPTENTNKTAEITKNSIENVNKTVEINKNPTENTNKTVEKPKIDIRAPKIGPTNYDNIKGPDLDKPISYSYLQDKIAKAQPGSILNLERNYKYSGSGDKYITIDKSITIDGKGHYIDGAGAAQIFKCTAKNINVVLKNMILKNAKNEGLLKYYAGGALYNEKADFKVINCQFLDNVAGKGPAIYSEKPISLQSCTFKNNWAKDYGGAIYCDGDMTVNGSVFEANTAKTEDGGAIYCDGNIIVNDSGFYHNTAKVDGGAIYCTGKASLRNDIFNYNKAETANSKCFGGAVRAKNGCDINSCTFSENHAEDYGGAVYSDEQVNIKGATRFQSNGAGKYGGAVYSKKPVYINVDEKDPQQVVFETNDVVKYAGGGIYSEGKVYANNCKFQRNDADTDGGAIYAKGEVKVRHCDFSWNLAMTAKNQVFNSFISNYGGAIKSEQSVTIDGTIFSGCGADYGGAVYAEGEVSIKDSLFDGCVAKHDGGAVYAKTIKEVSDSTFKNNIAESQGGAIHIKDKCNPKFISTRFLQNSAGKEGGAVFINRMGSGADVSYCVFIGNRAKSGKDIYNCGHYNQINMNWHGTNNPNFTNAFKIYEPFGSDKDYGVANYLKIDAKVNESELHMNNTYKLSTYYKSSNGKPVDQNLVRQSGWNADPNFNGANYLFPTDDSCTFTMRTESTHKGHSIDFKVRSKNPVLKLKVDNETLTVTPTVVD